MQCSNRQVPWTMWQPGHLFGQTLTDIESVLEGPVGRFRVDQPELAHHMGLEGLSHLHLAGPKKAWVLVVCPGKACLLVAHHRCAPKCGCSWARWSTASLACHLPAWTLRLKVMCIQNHSTMG